MNSNKKRDLYADVFSYKTPMEPAEERRARKEAHAKHNAAKYHEKKLKGFHPGKAQMQGLNNSLAAGQ